MSTTYGYDAVKNDTKAPTALIKYTGAYLDPTGLYHLRARQYDPSTGRFTTQDPLPNPVLDPYVSAYAYANDAPTVLVDPSGLRAGTCGKIRCWVGSDQGQTDIACSLYGASLAAGAGELVLSTRAGIAFVRGLVVGAERSSVKEGAKLGRFGATAGGLYALSTVAGGCSERELLQHVGIG